MPACRECVHLSRTAGRLTRCVEHPLLSGRSTFDDKPSRLVLNTDNGRLETVPDMRVYQTPKPVPVRPPYVKPERAGMLFGDKRFTLDSQRNPSLHLPRPEFTPTGTIRWPEYPTPPDAA